MQQCRLLTFLPVRQHSGIREQALAHIPCRLQCWRNQEQHTASACLATS